MKDFDATFGTAAETTGREVTIEEKEAAPKEDFSWGSIFRDEPTDAPQWHQKYDHLVVGKFQWSGAVTAYLVGNGDQDGAISKLFVEGVEETVIEAMPGGVWSRSLVAGQQGVPAHGGGRELQGRPSGVQRRCGPRGAGGQSFMSMRNGSQDKGQDGNVMSLRSLIQKCEADGMVDIDLGGHTYQQPPAVMQGMESDQPLSLALFQWQAEVPGG